MKIVAAIIGSPRKNSYSTRLLNSALKTFTNEGWNVELFDCCSEDFSPCNACMSCHQNGVCVFDDAAQRFLEKIEKADALIFATPIWFFGLSSKLKQFVDRCQPLWAKKFILKETAEADESRPCGLIAVAGGESSPRMFLPSEIEINVLANSLNFTLCEKLQIKGTDKLDDDFLLPLCERANEMARRIMKHNG